MNPDAPKSESIAKADSAEAAQPLAAEVPKLHSKTVVLKSGRVSQIVCRLRALGFKWNVRGVYVNPNADANIQQVSFGHDLIDANKWVALVILARNATRIQADLQLLDLCQADDIVSDQQRQAELERELRLAKEYWRRRIKEFIGDRKLQGVDLYVAEWAHSRLREAARKATDWNATEEGSRSPVAAEAFSELAGEQYRRPEALFADEFLTPEILAGIAAPLINKGGPERTPADAVRLAHELLMAAQRYIGALPKKSDTFPESWIEDFRMTFSHVTFEEIQQSNQKNSRRLPLLPPEPPERNEGQLSREAIKTAVVEFIEQRVPSLTQEDYERDPKKTETGKAMTYQEWQREEQESIDDCAKHGRISLGTLCHLRWDRFRRFCDKQQNIALTRDSTEAADKQPSPQLALSAASTPVYSGKREKEKSAPVD